jgi:hypothetical protein
MPFLSSRPILIQSDPIPPFVPSRFALLFSRP